MCSSSLENVMRSSTVDHVHAARRYALAASGLFVVLSLAGCVVAPPYGAAYGPGYVDPATGAVVVAPMAPPSPYAETVTVAPGPGYFWIGGYWSWVGGRHVWTRGRWEAHRPGYRWEPRHWEQGPGGWHQRGGHWAR
jgi:hypothetical protein